MKFILILILHILLYCNNYISNVESKRFCVINNNNNNESSSVSDNNNSDCLVEGYYAPVKNVLQNLCGLNDESTLKILTIEKNVIKADKLLKTICSTGLAGVLSWISASDYEEYIKPILNVTEELPLVVRNSLIGGTPNLTPLSNDNLEKKNNNYNNINVVEILMERLPSSYALRNLKYSSWQNVTIEKKIILGYTTLINNRSTSKFVHGEIEYGYEGLELIEFKNPNILSSVPKTIYDNDLNVRNFPFDNRRNFTAVEVDLFVKGMPSRTQINVTLEGSWSHLYYNVEGDLILYFDDENADNEYIENNKFKAQITETKMTNVNQIYGEFIHLINYEDPPPIIMQNETTMSTTIRIPSLTTEYIDLTTVKDETLFVVTPKPDSWYPGFKPYFTFACVILSALVIIVTIDVTRNLLRGKRVKTEKHTEFK